MHQFLSDMMVYPVNASFYVTPKAGSRDRSLGRSPRAAWSIQGGRWIGDDSDDHHQKNSYSYHQNHVDHHNHYQYVPHKAVAEVSKIAKYRRLVAVNHGSQSKSTDGSTSGWRQRRVVGVVLVL